MGKRDGLQAPLYKTLVLRARNFAVLRMHMPGHKGKRLPGRAFRNISKIDFTELTGTGDLYRGRPPISDAERLCADNYGAANAYFLPGGSTQGLYSAIFLACKPGDKLICDRNAHRAAVNAMALMSVTPVYISAETTKDFNIPGEITSGQVESAIRENPDAKAVLIVSPTYYGVMSDISEISKITKAHGVTLIVDQAHGAHLPYLDRDLTAMNCGADIMMTSFHKTLPALTPAAILCTNRWVAPEEVRYTTSLFGSSSPSYPLMASIDSARRYMEGKGALRLSKTIDIAFELRAFINDMTHFKTLSSTGLYTDPLHLTVCTSCGGLSGEDAAARLAKRSLVICELSDQNNILLMLSPMDGAFEFRRLMRAFASLSKYADKFKTGDHEANYRPTQIYETSPNMALFSKAEYLPLRDAVGRVCASVLAAYPPGIPIVSLGEIITDEQVSYLISHGFAPNSKVRVCKHNIAEEVKPAPRRGRPKAKA